MDALVLPLSPSREQVQRLEDSMRALEGEHGVQLETEHDFADGMVARTIFIPAGTLLTGEAHKHEQLNICCGDIEVLTPTGMKRLVGYHVIPGAPGVKRVGRTFADTWWTTVCLNPDNSRDIDAIEDRLVENPGNLQRRLVLPGAPRPEVLN